MDEKLKALGAHTPPAVWLSRVQYESQAGAGRDSSQLEPAGGGALAGAQFTFEGFCFFGNTEQEVETLNNWTRSLSEDKTFSGNFKSVTLEDVRRDEYETRTVTRFRVVAKE